MPSDRDIAPYISILDRIINDEMSTKRPNVQQLRQAVRRDLEQLLNARRSWLPLDDNQYPELSTSVLGYGLPDFTAMELTTEDGRQWLCEEVQRTIIRFEPRLSKVRVSLKDAEKEAPLDRILRLRIDAILMASPLPTPVVFDSELEPINLSVKLQESA